MGSDAVAGSQVLSDFDRYRIIYRLGQGGMAEVWLAQLRGFDKRVAIKVISPELSEDEQLRRYFSEEARRVRDIRHPNLVESHFFGQTPDERLFIEMEYVEGRDLAWLLFANCTLGVRFPVEFACHLALEVAEGLWALHDWRGLDGRRRTIVHCDVSPGNVLVSWRGAVKLADFGIAQQLSGAVERSESSPAPRRFAKAGYAAPEFYRGAGRDTRYDLFGLGAILFELITHSPLSSVPREEVAQRVVSAPHQPAEQIGPDGMQQLGLLVAECLAEEPGRRPASADDVIRRLGQLLRDEGVDRRNLRARVAAWLREVYRRRSEVQRQLGGSPTGGSQPVGGPTVADPLPTVSQDLLPAQAPFGPPPVPLPLGAPPPIDLRGRHFHLRMALDALAISLALAAAAMALALTFQR